MVDVTDLVEKTCPRCKGHRKIRGQQGNRYKGEDYKLPNYKQVSHGICFLCDGSGRANFTSDLSVVLKEKNGVWLKYNPINGNYIGMLEMESALEMEFAEPVFEIDECVELDHDKFETYYKNFRNSRSSSRYWEDYSVADLERDCNLPEGVGLFDDDR